MRAAPQNDPGVLRLPPALQPRCVPSAVAVGRVWFGSMSSCVSLDTAAHCKHACFVSSLGVCVTNLPIMRGVHLLDGCVIGLPCCRINSCVWCACHGAPFGCARHGAPFGCRGAPAAAHRGPRRPQLRHAQGAGALPFCAFPFPVLRICTSRSAICTWRVLGFCGGASCLGRLFELTKCAGSRGPECSVRHVHRGARVWHECVRLLAVYVRTIYLYVVRLNACMNV